MLSGKLFQTFFQFRVISGKDFRRKIDPAEFDSIMKYFQNEIFNSKIDPFLIAKNEFFFLKIFDIWIFRNKI